MIKRALSSVLDELKFNSVDNLIISLDSSLSSKDIDSIWKQVEKEVIILDSFVLFQA